MHMHVLFFYYFLFYVHKRQFHVLMHYFLIFSFCITINCANRKRQQKTRVRGIYIYMIVYIRAHKPNNNNAAHTCQTGILCLPFIAINNNAK